MESASSENGQGPPSSAGAHAATVELEPTQTLPRDGWLDSGYRAYRVEGETYITSRVKNLIIRGGRNIYPRQVELSVGELAGVHKDCVVMFGAPDRGCWPRCTPCARPPAASCAATPACSAFTSARSRRRCGPTCRWFR
ncbi:MAG: hypothetical protein KGL33_00105 [Betaproteobacteria bacterium]|uniref:hypothetical protein n=1 Tax=Thiomonas arsenitoxydans (strain DSM 22701 / CIP 110005 / 3As) TaxID=426114 RepID=UPI0023952A7A|nr:hypothetical protein [Thiomonas arsenitoxydans]MDE2267409.1 hypothetical protein [Betaproteobacteria bacterium]HML80766.1 hypothetical protein [Thiomonas arsenitoxydans]